MTFIFSCFRVPEVLSFDIHRYLFISLLSSSFTRWPAGDIALMGFNVWAKVEIHNMVGDYGWYWGDYSFQRFTPNVSTSLVSLFTMLLTIYNLLAYQATLGTTASHSFLVVMPRASLVGHAAQFSFVVVFFENPRTS